MSIEVAKEVLSVTTVKEFDELVERMKISHPIKYAMRLADGDFDRQRALLKGKKEEVKEIKEEKETKKKS